MSRFWWKKKLRLYHVRQAEEPYYHASRGLMSGCDFSAVQLANSLISEYNRTLTTDIFLSTGRCDRAGNKQLTGSLQQEYSHSWHWLAIGVVLIQLGVGVDVMITPWQCCCGAALRLRKRFAKTIRLGIRHCAMTI